MPAEPGSMLPLAFLPHVLLLLGLLIVHGAGGKVALVKLCCNGRVDPPKFKTLIVVSFAGFCSDKPFGLEVQNFNVLFVARLNVDTATTVSYNVGSFPLKLIVLEPEPVPP